jgi:hypothetical protein
MKVWFILVALVFLAAVLGGDIAHAQAAAPLDHPLPVPGVATTYSATCIGAACKPFTGSGSV